jgi:hypothetical protein
MSPYTAKLFKRVLRRSAWSADPHTWIGRLDTVFSRLGHGGGPCPAAPLIERTAGPGEAVGGLIEQRSGLRVVAFGQPELPTRFPGR